MDIREIGNTYKAQLSSSDRIKKDNGFKEIFDRKVSEINTTTPQTHIDSKAHVLEHSDKILTLLDNYARNLIDPAKTLRDIEPLVKSIEKEVSLVEAEAAEKTHNDKDLERFIKDLALTAHVAAFKFHRGDYI